MKLLVAIFVPTLNSEEPNKIDESLHVRNGGLEEGERIQYQQLFYFHYRDGAKMMTVGGLLHAENQSNEILKCNFENLSFICTGDEFYNIT